MKNRLIIRWTILAGFATLMITLGLSKNKALNWQNMRFKDYPKEWATIDSLEQQGLLRSALDKVETLYARAKSEKEIAQIVKALIYRGKLINNLEEDGEVKAINNLSKELADTPFPASAVLQSMLGQLYKNYFDQNYWKLANRTTIADYRPDDLQTWSAEQIQKASAEFYLASVADEKLKTIPINQLDAALIKAQNVDGIWPTLFDLLAQRAISHFANDRNQVTSPVYKFNIDRADAFAPAADFAKQSYPTRDSSWQWQALGLYQKVLAFHLNDAQPNALLDANLKRLSFVRNGAVLPNKDALYQDALEALLKKYAAIPQSTEIQQLIAQEYINLGRTYQRGEEDEKARLALVKAKSICESAIKAFPKSYGASLCRQQLVDLNRQSLQTNMEEVVLPQKNLLVNLVYRNIKTVYFRLIKITEEQKRKYDTQKPENQLGFLKKMTPLKKWSVALPDDGDLQEHASEIALDGLPLGQYVLIGSELESMGNADLLHPAISFFAVSNIGVLSRQDENGRTSFLVMNRENGAPLSGVKATFFINDYNRITRIYNEKEISSAVSDKDGFIAANLVDQSFRARFTWGEDVLNHGSRYYSYQRQEVLRDEENTFFFLDRAIYRPGQTIYYKGIVLRTKGDEKPEIAPNKPVIVTFHDANGQKIETKELVTNAYGTFNGAFVAPTGGLRGEFSLSSSAGADFHSLRIEEYKRPTFEVSLKPLEGEQRLGETVKVSGVAQAYAGNSINGAKVTYRVVRKANFPYWSYWRRGEPNFSSTSMEIAVGETTTDADGKFDISFLAEPDRSIARDQKPEFQFAVSVDVVDITGETHSGSRNVNLGYIGLRLAMEVQENFDQKDPQNIKVKSTNLDGQFKAATGKISVYRLKGPDQPRLTRYWTVPDRALISETDFRKKFPNLAYGKNDDQTTWPREATVLDVNFNTEKSDSIALPIANLQPGHYLVVLTSQDEKGEKLELSKPFTTFNSQTKRIPADLTFWNQWQKEGVEPGQAAILQMAANGDDFKTLLEIERKGKIVTRKWIDVKRWQEEAYAVTEADRGGLFFHLTTVWRNRPILNNVKLEVSWASQDLNIEYQTFRDKLLPGQDEEWRLKITGPGGEKVAAEMAAALYDASLDNFVGHTWGLDPFPQAYSSSFYWSQNTFNDISASLYRNPTSVDVPFRTYPYLNWFGYLYDEGAMAYNGIQTRTRSAYRGKPGMQDATIAYSMAPSTNPAPKMAVAEYRSNNEPAPAPSGQSFDSTVTPEKPQKYGELKENKPAKSDAPFSPRTNLKETVFFFPELYTDADGAVIIKFKMNEALTRWKFLGLATTKDLKIGATSREVVTQKDLMVQPNAPRFVREGDEIEYTAKVTNLSAETLTGSATLQLFDAVSMQSADAKFGLSTVVVPFTVAPKQSAPLTWKLKVPFGEVTALTHRVIATAGNFSDGEESVIPVLTNRMLVTETLPLFVRANQSRSYTLQSMIDNRGSSTMTPHKLTLEFTSNPAWLAVKSLPYLMEFPHECTEQVFSRYYANSLASSVVSRNPKIKQVFDKWKGTTALQSNLRANQELKSALLEETPWVMEAQSEEKQRQQIALLFDLDKMASEELAALEKIRTRQLPNGGWAWFPGGQDSWFITQYLMAGFGHLDQLGVQPKSDAEEMIKNAVKYLDEKSVDQYEELKKTAKKGSFKLDEYQLDDLLIYYLYTRSFYPELLPNAKTKEVMAYVTKQAQLFWTKKGLYQQGLIALALQRGGDQVTPQLIVKSLRERALQSDELGMYWKYNRGFMWSEAPVETHSLLIEVFSEVAKDAKAVEELKVWLLRNKQTTHWKTTKATAEAIYALLNTQGKTDLLADAQPVALSFDKVKNKENLAIIGKAQSDAEPGTGYFKTSWEGKNVKAGMETIKVSNPNSGIAWGGLYWQYFENLDKIKSFEATPLQLKKRLFKEEKTATGPVLREITANQPLHPGDKLVVRVELRSDRDMEYLHLKDMRASGMEPMNVLSQYKYQGGLGYYESTGDAATHFFIDNLAKGTYVFEYALRVTHRGTFSNGISSIQCMYAPEFSSFSSGEVVSVK